MSFRISTAVGIALFFLVSCASVAVSISAVDTNAGYNIYAEWQVLDYLWDETHTREDYLNSDAFIPANNALAGINVDARGNVYVTVPRWTSGVPGTLNKVVQNSTGQYVLSPWPSWDMQEVGVAGDLQNCQSMTIDSTDRMWVIEVGRRNFFEAPTGDPVVNGPAGVWMIDVPTGEILNKYEFPSDVVSYTESFVNDLVLDEGRQLAYLTDAWGDGGLIVYDYQGATSRRYAGPSTMYDPNYVMIINGVNYGTEAFPTPVDGIAISDDQEAIFYCSLQGTDLFRLPTAILRDFTSTQEQITAAVEELGFKQPSDGMMYRNGVLYFGSLTESTYYALPVTATSIPDTEIESVPVWPQQVDFRWVDTFCRDWSDGSVFWFISNSLDLFFTGGMDFSGSAGNSNFRIVSAPSTDTSLSSSDDNDDDNVEALQAAVISLSLILVLGLVVGSVLFYRMKQGRGNGQDNITTPLM